MKSKMYERVYSKQQLSSGSFHENAEEIVKTILSAKEIIEKCNTNIIQLGKVAQIVTDEVKKWCGEKHIAYQRQNISAKEVNNGNVAVFYDGTHVFTIVINHSLLPGQMVLCRPLGIPLGIKIEGNIMLENQ